MSQRKPSGPSAPDFKAEPGGDLYEGSKPGADSKAAIQSETAPEVSRGAWRERAFVPRGTMPREQILSELERALQVASLRKGAIEPVRVALKSDWAPLLRQAVEQGGGDGLDGYLRRVLKISGPPATDPLVTELYASFCKLNAARHLPVLLAEARAGVIEAVARATEPDRAKKVSLKVLERQLEGRIEVGALLEILFCDDDELAERLEQVERTIQSLRDQLRGMPGSQPDGMFSNYARLKAEKKVIDGEQVRRKEG